MQQYQRPYDDIHKTLESLKSQVHNFSSYVETTLKPYLQSKVVNFRGGQLSDFYSEWQKLTPDASILQCIAGDNIKFTELPPTQTSYTPNQINGNHKVLINKEIDNLLSKGIIIECDHEPGEFILPIFSVPKKDGSVRLILNLKKLNTFVEFAYFKMETIHIILQLVTQNCWMSSIDLKDAYYSVKVSSKFQKYLKFFHEGKLFKFTAWPNGLFPCPRRS